MSILTSAAARPLLEILRSSRNGIVYGGKIRFSHALVINMLYRSGPLGPRLKQVLTATKDHALVLAAFAIIYKATCKILENEFFLGSAGAGAALAGNRSGLIKFLAGAVGSWVVYSQHFPYFHPGITHQITLYCFSRVLIASGKILLDHYLACRQPTLHINNDRLAFRDLTELQKKKYRAAVYNKTWKYFAVLTWALVMFIYDYQPQYLQSSLRHSMAYIYDVELQSWPTWRDFLGF
jgi:peroxisomal membrane protein 4